MYATGKYSQGLMGPAIGEGSFKSIKLYTILLAWPWRVQNFLFCFCSLNSKCATCVFTIW